MVIEKENCSRKGELLKGKVSLEIIIIIYITNIVIIFIKVHNDKTECNKWTGPTKVAEHLQGSKQHVKIFHSSANR